MLYRYQPVLRGETRTIEPGPVTWPTARAHFEQRAREAGYELAPHTGSSIVARRPGTPLPRVRYVQHPHEPTSMLGLGPFAESHVLGRARYLAEEVGSPGYRMLTMTNECERALLVGRRLAAGLPVYERVLEDVTGASLAAWRGEAIGALLERGEVAMNEADRAISPSASPSPEARWSLLDARTLRAIAGAPGDEPISDWRERLGPIAARESFGHDGPRDVHERALVLDDLLLDAETDALAAWLSSLAGPLGARLARAVFDGVIDASPILRVEQGLVSEAAEETVSFRVLAPTSLGTLGDDAPGAREALRELAFTRGRSGLLTRVALAPDAPLLVALAKTIARARLEGVEALLETGGDTPRLLLRALATGGSSTLEALARRLGIQAREVGPSRERAQTIALEIACDGSLPRLGLRTRDARALRAHDPAQTSPARQNPVKRRLPRA